MMTRLQSRILTDDEMYLEFRRAQDYLAFQQPIAAARVIAPVVDRDPGNMAALELLARAYYESAQLGRAETALRALVEACPDDGWARHALARTLERTGRSEEAAQQRRVATALGVTD